MKDMFYKEPTELPAGFWEACQPFAVWAMKAVKAAYESGYSAGRIDTTLLSAKARERAAKM